MAHFFSRSFLTLSRRPPPPPPPLLLPPPPPLSHGRLPSFLSAGGSRRRPVAIAATASFSTAMGEGTAGEGVMEFLASLTNYERQGMIPDGAGTDSARGFDLRRMHRLLSRLGNPHTQYPVVHVAGTKGKGSTVAFISNILRAQGYSVGTYTSPHLETIRERLTAGRVAEPISTVALQALFEDVQVSLKDAVTAEHGALTHFEVFTALAFKHFARENVNIAVIEAGLGGARDATNVIPASNLAAAVITNIGEEHMNALGGSLESIAFAKAGIIKDGCLVVLGGPMDSGIEKIFRKVADSRKAKVIPSLGVGVSYSIQNVYLGDETAFQCCDVKVKVSIEDELQGGAEMKIEKFGLRLHALGTHQLINAITAICAILCLRKKGWKIQDHAIWAGLERTFIPGRFQLVGRRDANKIGCEDPVLVLDGAHTASSAIALAETLRTLFQKEPIAFVVAMALDKNHSSFAKQLLLGTRPTVVVTTEVPVVGAYTRSTPADVLANIWSQTADENDMVVHILNSDGGAEKDGKGLWKHSLSKPAAESGHDPFLNAQLKMSPMKGEIYVSQEKSMKDAIEKASHLLISTSRNGVVCVTGSLHAISAVLSLLQNHQ